MVGRTRSLEGSACTKRPGLDDEAQDRTSNDHSRGGCRSRSCGGLHVGTGEVEAPLKAGKELSAGCCVQSCVPLLGKQRPIVVTPSAIAQSLPKKAWRRLLSPKGSKVRAGTTEPILSRSRSQQYSDDFAREWTRSLLIRRNIADGSLALFSTWCPKDIHAEAGVGRPIAGLSRTASKSAKNEFGLDHKETRSWHGRHRHVSRVMLAFAMMSVIRHRAKTGSSLKKRDCCLD